MDWNDLRRSENVEDTRGSSYAGLGRGMVPLGLGGLIVLLVGSLLFGLNPLDVLQLLSGGGEGTSSYVQRSPPPDDRTVDFVRAVLGDTEDTWRQLFQQQLGVPYREPTLVLFSGGIDSACGFAATAVGPFYCPRDAKVYLDMGFFQAIRAAAGAQADFARAYAMAHEVGHHIQHLLGIADKVRQAQAGANQATANQLSVRLELQADCFAGIWGHHTARRGIIDQQDVAAAMQTAAQIGDDYLQRRARGTVAPETFTHGSSQQRVQWFRRGLEHGSISQCNTLAASQL
ncbi:MAG: neutral zinc metallopeptidase [Candidatus Tectimicrobiota bacterium]